MAHRRKKLRNKDNPSYHALYMRGYRAKRSKDPEYIEANKRNCKVNFIAFLLYEVFLTTEIYWQLIYLRLTNINLIIWK